jgi:hypothetical protein
MIYPVATMENNTKTSKRFYVFLWITKDWLWNCQCRRESRLQILDLAEICQTSTTKRDMLYWWWLMLPNIETHKYGGTTSLSQVYYQIWFIWDKHGQTNNQIGLVVAGGHMGCLCLVVLQSVDSYRRVDGVEGGGGGAEGAWPGDNHMKNCSCPLHDIVGVVEHHFPSFIFMIIYVYIYLVI